VNDELSGSVGAGTAALNGVFLGVVRESSCAIGGSLTAMTVTVSVALAQAPPLSQIS
jgi:hypothetical protein